MADISPTAEGKPVVRVQPGVPGLIERLESGNGAYPDSTTDIVKLLRVAEFDVLYDEPPESRSIVAHNAADFWMPVLTFTVTFSWSVIAGIVGNLLTSLLGKDRVSRSQLHIKVGRTNEIGETSYFEGSGPAPDVLRALEMFNTDD